MSNDGADFPAVTNSEIGPIVIVYWPAAPLLLCSKSFTRSATLKRARRSFNTLSRRSRMSISTTSDDENDSHKIRRKIFKQLCHIELATNTSSSKKFGSIHFATLFEIMAT